VATPPEHARHFTEALLLLPHPFHLNGHRFRPAPSPPPRGAVVRHFTKKPGDEAVLGAGPPLDGPEDGQISGPAHTTLPGAAVLDAVGGWAWVPRDETEAWLREV